MSSFLRLQSLHFWSVGCLLSLLFCVTTAGAETVVQTPTEDMKHILVNLHQRYAETVQENAKLLSQVQALQQEGTLANTPSPQGSVMVETALQKRLTEATQALENAIQTIQNQQRQIETLSERVNTLQSLQMEGVVTLTGEEETPLLPRFNAPILQTTSFQGKPVGGAATMRTPSPEVTRWVNQATTLRKAGRYVQAEACLEKALRVSPQEATIYYNLGNLYAEEQALLKAKNAYLKALNLKPNFVQAYYNVGLIYDRLNDAPNAQWYLKEYLQRVPNSPHRADIDSILSKPVE